MTLQIKKADLDKIFHHARECHPLEACGILAGRIAGEGKAVEKIYPAKNVLNSASEYEIDPVEQLKIFEDAENAGLGVLGFYHSHPFWEPFWSEIDDERSSLWTGYSYLIVSLKTGGFSTYIRKESKVEKEEVRVL